jgi:hypothetical protein
VAVGAVRPQLDGFDEVRFVFLNEDLRDIFAEAAA